MDHVNISDNRSRALREGSGGVLLLIQRARLVIRRGARGFVHGLIGYNIVLFWHALNKSQMKMELVPIYQDCYASQFLTLS
jgi:hypothetical protein